MHHSHLRLTAHCNLPPLIPNSVHLLQVDYSAKRMTLGSDSLGEGDELSLNGTTGEVIVGRHPTKPPELSGDMSILMVRSWERQEGGAAVAACGVSLQAAAAGLTCRGRR